MVSVCSLAQSTQLNVPNCLSLRCQSALYWRMFLIKQPSTAHVHKVRPLIWSIIHCLSAVCRSYKNFLSHQRYLTFFYTVQRYTVVCMFKSGQRKSPFLGGLSPLPSPASVGSTASSSSAGGNGGTASHSTDSTVALPRHIYNKAADHLTVSALVYTCLDLWRLSDSYMQQCRGKFL